MRGSGVLEDYTSQMMRFSQRTPRALDPNRLTRLLHEKRRKQAPILDLTQSNPTRTALRYPHDEIRRALCCEDIFSYSPAPLGLPAARHAVSRYYTRRGRAVDPNDIVLTASTSEAYSLLFKLFLDPGDHVLAPQPGYPLIDALAQGEGGEAVGYPFILDDAWQPDFEALEALAGPRIRLLSCVHPNNPTGAFLKPSEWKRLKEFVLTQGIVAICDEVFFDYPVRIETTTDAPREAVFDPLFEDEAPLVVLNGLSKMAALPQMKLAWMLLRGPADFKRQVRSQLEHLLDHFLSLGAPVQAAASRLIETAPIVRDQLSERIAGNLRRLQTALADSALQALPVEGGWNAVLRLPRVLCDEDFALQLLEKSNVLVHPGYLFDFSQDCFCVVSLISPRGIFEQGIARIAEAANKL